MDGVLDQSRLVFADEKPLKPLDLYRLVRRDPFTGTVPFHTADSANKKIRYNIFAAVTVKPDIRRNVEHLVLDHIGDSYLFRAFVMHLIITGTLREGDIFVVDNCSIHFKGENDQLEEVLWNEFEILMVRLPPYYPELNPTEFVFGHLVVQLRNKFVRSRAQTEEDFVHAVQQQLDEIKYKTVVNQYKHCGYLKNM